MGVFDDHKLEQMDWMTQITETIDSDLNTILSRLPDRTPVTPSLIIESSYSYLSLSVRNVLQGKIRKEVEGSLSWEESRLLDRCFEFHCVGEPEIDLRDDSIKNGEIYLVKVVSTIADEQLLPLMGLQGIEAINRIEGTGTDAALIQRMNDVMDMLGGCQEFMKNKSVRKKLNAIKSRLKDIFKNNEWRIRDMKLANKIGFWIKGYITHGNLADLTNFTKLKVMTHNNMPIYSVKEEIL